MKTFLSTLVGPEKSRPQSPTVVLALASFCLSLVLGAFAARYPTPWVRYVWFSLAGALLVAILMVVTRDFSSRESRRHPYRRNLCNTIITVCVTILILPILFYLLWYPNLHRQVLQFNEDTVDAVYFPSVAVFQREDWSSQASLDTASVPPKCFLGWYNSSAPNCDSNITPPGTQSVCRCNESWTQEVQTLEWQGVNYRYLNMQASTGMRCDVPTTQMILQVSYWYNSAQALEDSGWTLSPSLWLAIYDPTLTLNQALENNYTRMILVNANGMTAINLDLNYRQSLGTVTPAYDYGLSISTIPASGLVCDLGSNTTTVTGPCHASLFIQIPSFTRHVSLMSEAISWTDVVSSAGAYFSFVQLVSWILSGMALQT